VLATLAAAGTGLPRHDLERRLRDAGVDAPAAELDRLHVGGLLDATGNALAISPAGVRRLLELHAAIEAALDPSPDSPAHEECPSLPWITTVRTEWIDAVSLNYAVDVDALGAILPAPLEPEIHKGTGWVQVLMSSLREMRPQGAPGLFGVDFYQVSYRAAVQYRSADGSLKRGGYFVRSETSDPVLREVGNALAEFKFHEFGLAQMVMLRAGDRLTLGVDPGETGSKLVGIFDTGGSELPPAGSVWASLDELHVPLVECYDALGVDRENGWLYVLTIDRDPWQARFADVVQVYSEWMDEKGPLAGHARLDSVLHVPRCAYRWRPLRREPLSRASADPAPGG
jgi:uncharacterized protein YqjF (DUF2071 family)